ncbi:MAG: NAD-dependent epimerase/dehydratase family protein [Planctomycetaceae bacterium]
MSRGAGTATIDCLVTGGTGLVGNNVLRMLAGEGRRVRSLVRSRSGERELAGVAAERITGDVTDPDAVRRAVAGARVVIHAAAVVHVGWSRLADMRRVNVEGTRLVAEAARREGARFVQVSSVNALGLTGDGTPADEETPFGNTVECPYVITKREAEQAVLEEVDRGLDAVILNPVFMLGAWDWKPSSGRMLLEVAQGKGLFAPPGSQHFGDCRDIAAAIIAAIDRGATGRRYILGGHHRSFLDAWTVFARVTGRRPPVCRAPQPLVRFAGRVGDLLGRCTGTEGPLNSAAATMSLLHQNFTSSRAQQELGYTLRPLEDTVEHAWRWFVDHGYATPRRAAMASAASAAGGT